MGPGLRGEAGLLLATGWSSGRRHQCSRADRAGTGGGEGRRRGRGRPTGRGTRVPGADLHGRRPSALVRTHGLGPATRLGTVRQTHCARAAAGRGRLPHRGLHVHRLRARGGAPGPALPGQHRCRQLHSRHRRCRGVAGGLRSRHQGRQQGQRGLQQPYSPCRASLLGIRGHLRVAKRREPHRAQPDPPCTLQRHQRLRAHHSGSTRSWGVHADHPLERSPVGIRPIELASPRALSPQPQQYRRVQQHH